MRCLLRLRGVHRILWNSYRFWLEGMASRSIFLNVHLNVLYFNSRYLYFLEQNSLTFKIIFTLIVAILRCEVNHFTSDSYQFCLFVWVWGFKFSTHTVSFDLGWFFGLGCFPIVGVCGEAGLFHTAMLDSILRCGDVGEISTLRGVQSHALNHLQ